MMGYEQEKSAHLPTNYLVGKDQESLSFRWHCQCGAVFDKRMSIKPGRYTLQVTRQPSRYYR